MTRWSMVPITQEMITQGVRGDCTHCAVALALKQATGMPWHVGLTHAWPLGPAGSWQLPKTVRRLVADFDHGLRPLRPCSFRLPARFGGRTEQ